MCVGNVDPHDGSEVNAIVLYHVDDCIIAESDPDRVHLHRHFNEFSKMHLLGGPVQFSGCFPVGDREKGTWTIHQRSCIEEIVGCFDIEHTCVNNH